MKITKTGALSDGRHRLGRVGAALAMLLLASVTVWGISAWDQRETNAREAAVLAARLTDQIRLVGLLAEQVDASAKASADLKGAREDAATIVDRLAALDAAGPSTAELALLDQAIAAFDRDLDAYLAAGAVGEVAPPDTASVELALAVIEADFLAEADRADRVADVGSLLGFVAALMMAGVVVLRRRRESVLQDDALHEPVSSDPAEAAPAESTLAGLGRLGGVSRDRPPSRSGGDELASSTGWVQTLIDSLPDRIAVKDAAGRFARINFAQAVWLGLDDPDRAVGLDEHDFFDTATAEEIAAGDRLALQRGEPELDRPERRVDPRGGDERWGLVSRVPLRGADGRVVGLLSSWRDVTELRTLEATAQLWQQAVATIDAAIAIVDIGRLGQPIVEVNTAFERLTGQPRAHVVGRPIVDMLVGPSTVPRVGAEIRQAIVTGREATQTVQLAQAGGDTLWVELRMVALPATLPDSVTGAVDGSSGSRLLILTLVDVTERQSAERRVREAEAKYRTLVERNPAVTYAVRLGGGAAYVSPQIETLLGYPASAWRGDPNLRAKLVHPDDRLAWEAQSERATATGEPFKLEYRLIAKSGKPVWVRDEAVLVTDDVGEPAYWQGFLLDVSDRKALEERLKRQAFQDPLTGLPNEELLLDRVANALSRAGRAGRVVGALYLDLDDFGTINESLGRQTGDQVLRAVGRRLEQCVRQGDTVARLRADKFAFLLDELDDPAEAVRIAERVVEALRSPFRLARGEFFVTGSVGVAIRRSAFDVPEDLLRDAEAAMREAKARGKGRHVSFESGMATKTWARLDLELELRQGIEGDELVLHYQPIVALETGRIREVEALLRWNHPERGLVVPGDFVPLAEETGLIVPLGLKVMELGCRQVRAWQQTFPQSPPLSLAVNVSSQQFERPDFAEEVGRILVLTGLDPQCLKLEIAESVAMADADATAETMAELKALGVRLAIDDFGTGYSTMSYLERFAVDALKIDRAFVARLGPMGDDPAMVRAVIAFAKMLDLEVTAEGIESAEQLRRLRELGCDLGQGYHFAKPLSAEVMTDLLAAMPRWLDARVTNPPPRPRPMGVGTGLLPALPVIPAAS